MLDDLLTKHIVYDLAGTFQGNALRIRGSEVGD